MILYHGSDITVKNPNLNLSRKNLDFGGGFYTTENKDQAIDFSQKVSGGIVMENETKFLVYCIEDIAGLIEEQRQKEG